MTAVCGICVSNAVEENCYIFMPGCGHVFDRACLGVEYTCPKCKSNYLLPSPCRPFQLAGSASFIEHKELHKHLMHANCTITQLKDELEKTYEDLSVEQRSRKKSSESPIDLNQQLVALQEKYNNLNSNEIGRLAVAAISEEEAFITVDLGSSDIQATSRPRNPVPAKEPAKICEENIAYLQLQDDKIKAARSLQCSNSGTGS
ncbi:uncharacterized protein ATC70_003914 [Mucor velutinosus]|uniref:RING-type domain-containing protein n=1 Tax=Mucor velutinosus TaxID=708070 RepID=A0AAN7DA65_9FUNG|nr:hypothetical protein ATC70_003914 [Mucor velutinosus]